MPPKGPSQASFTGVLYTLQKWTARLWCEATCQVAKLSPPKYEPEKWLHYKDLNNCYNYACNTQNNTYAQPGYASGHMDLPNDCQSTTIGALSDGLVVHEDASQSTGCCHTVALAMAEGYDYHWYRKDASGLWSHKPAWMTVRNVDESGKPITDPQTADRGLYTQFCGYFSVCKCAVTISGTGPFK